MFTRLKIWWRKRRRLRTIRRQLWVKKKSEKNKPFLVWAVREHFVWVKVVSVEKPDVFPSSDRRGPFRSEVDAEEFCDHANTGKPYNASRK